MSKFTVSLPSWAEEEIRLIDAPIASLEERMRLVIRCSRLNIEMETGGPFAAGVFEADTGRLVALGVNRVVPMNCSCAHAEVVALSLAQQQLGGFDLGAPGLAAHQLVVNWRPCAMCYGALLWAGVKELVIAGSGPELEEITRFDEGPIHPEWQRELELRGVKVTDNVLKEEAIAVFKQFRDSGALVYNGRGGS